MRVIAHPMRLDSSGSFITVDDDSDRHAAQLAGVTLSTQASERGLAPEYGLYDPIASGVSLGVISATVSRCEPDLAVAQTTFETTTNGVNVRLSVAWAD